MRLSIILITAATSQRQYQDDNIYWTKVFTVNNGFDPDENWDMSNITTIDLIKPSACVHDDIPLIVDSSGQLSCLLLPPPQ